MNQKCKTQPTIINFHFHLVENVIQIKSGITINVDESVKNIYVKKIIFEILLLVVVKMVIT